MLFVQFFMVEPRISFFLSTGNMGLSIASINVYEDKMVKRNISCSISHTSALQLFLVF